MASLDGGEEWRQGLAHNKSVENFCLWFAPASQPHPPVHTGLRRWLKGYVEDLAGESAATPGKGATGKQVRRQGQTSVFDAR